MADRDSSMPDVIPREAVALFDYVHGRLSSRLVGITDDEYLWEPVPGCWTVRRASLDGQGEQLGDTPMTTIAWRICHVADAIARHPFNHFLNPDFTPSAREYPMTATGGVGYLERSYSEWRALMVSAPDDTWVQPLGPTAGPFAESTVLGVVLHNADEFIHHGAEVSLLRDLYRRRHERSSPV